MTFEQTLEYLKKEFPNWKWEGNNEDDEFPSFYGTDKDDKYEIQLCKEWIQCGWYCDILEKDSDDALFGISTTVDQSPIEALKIHFGKIQNELQGLNGLFNK